MRLILKNFKCYTEKTIELPNNGLTLIHGYNGVGKSTIFSAIIYALYGGTKKPCTYGTTSCKVTLETDVIKITRTSKPVRLLVTYQDYEYESDPAQSIIDSIFGNDEEFLASCYVSQTKTISVISMTPSQQLKFITLLSNSNAEDTKKKCKDRIKYIESKIQNLEGGRLVIDQRLKDRSESLVKPSTTLATIDEFSIKKEIDTYTKKLKRIERDIPELQNSLENSRKQESFFKTQSFTILTAQKEILDIEKGLSTFKPLPLGELEDEIKTLEATAESLVLHKQYKEQLNAYEKALKEHKEYVQKRMTELRPSLREEEEINNMKIELDNMKMELSSYLEKKTLYDAERAKIVSTFKEVRSLDSGAFTIKKVKDMLNYLSVIMSCPSCDVPLKVTGPSLVINDTEESLCCIDKTTRLRYIEEITESMKYKDPGEAPYSEDDIKKFERELENIISSTKEYSSLCNTSLPTLLVNMKKRVDSLKPNTYLDTEVPQELEELKDTIKSKRDEFATLKKIHNDRLLSEQSLPKKKAFLASLKKTLPAKPEGSAKALEQNLANMTKSIIDINLQISSKRELLDSYRAFLKYKEARSEIKVIKKELASFDSLLATQKDNLDGYLQLEKAIKQAEILSLEETVKKINSNAKTYLDEMFDIPISVTIEMVKEYKKGTSKLQFNTKIDYKGSIDGTIDDLSAGERQKCNLAFLLAVNDMMGHNILLLDECFNNLDHTKNEEILTFLRDMSGDKAIYVISQEAVQGIFDNTLSLE